MYINKLPLKIDWLIKLLPNNVATRIYSYGRTSFMDKFYHQTIKQKNNINYPNNMSKTLWGIEFRYPLFNAAGMFKNAEGYDIVATLGAGGYIGGTSTVNRRLGNIKHDIKHPFITLHKSNTSVNSLGLPNLGDSILSHKNITTKKILGCPIGWSLMRSPDLEIELGLKQLVESLFKFQDNLQIDFIEINESCPNVGADFNNLELRLEYIANNFMCNRKRNIPIILKLSNDTNSKLLPSILDILFKYKFDGVNIGNTSTMYNDIATQLDLTEQKLFNYFTSNFGGGVGGNLLKKTSLELCKIAVDYRNKIKPDYEFNIIRTGGIDCLQDIIDSNNNGISLNQWYTGFFTNYLKYGNDVYTKFIN